MHEHDQPAVGRQGAVAEERVQTAIPPVSGRAFVLPGETFIGAAPLMDVTVSSPVLIRILMREQDVAVAGAHDRRAVQIAIGIDADRDRLLDRDTHAVGKNHRLGHAESSKMSVMSSTSIRYICRPSPA